MISKQMQIGYFKLGHEHGSDHVLARRRRLVETLWSVRVAKPQDFLVLPDGCADLILSFKLDPEASGTSSCKSIEPIIVGPSTAAISVPITVDDGFLGVRLKPEQARLLKRPNDVADKRLSGEDAFKRIPLLRALPKETHDFEALVVAFRALLDEMPDGDVNLEMARAVDLVHFSGGRVGISELCQSLDVAERQLHRLFLRHVGLSPKAYVDVIRFQRAARLCRRGMSIGQCAFEAGYSDQGHMSRAFRKHGGFTPARMPDFSLGSIPVGMVN